jgi:hypothetical protein
LTGMPHITGKIATNTARIRCNLDARVCEAPCIVPAR